MLLYMFSDTHGRHEELNVPQCDMAIFCGDMSNSIDLAKNFHECDRFLSWYNNLNIKHKIFIAGNHDLSFVHPFYLDLSKYETLHYLCHSSITIDGIKIFGSPFTPEFGKSLAFMYNRCNGSDVWADLDNDCDILVTHGPPLGILDLAINHRHNTIVQVGCRNLLERTSLLNTKIHCFGHIHSNAYFNNFGYFYNGKKSFANCSIVTDSGEAKQNSKINPGISITLEV